MPMLLLLLPGGSSLKFSLRSVSILERVYEVRVSTLNITQNESYFN